MEGAAAAPARPAPATRGAGLAGACVVPRALYERRDVVVVELAGFRAESRSAVGAAAARVPLERGWIDHWSRVFQVAHRYRPAAIVHTVNVMDVAYLNRNP